MDELEATACHFDNLRRMITVMKNDVIENLAKELGFLFDEFVQEVENVYDIKLTALSGLEDHIVGKSHVIDPQRFFRSAMVRSLLTFRYESSKTFTSGCFGSIIACEASADNLKFVENYHMKTYEEGSHVVIYYMCETEHDPLLIKFIKVSVRDQGGKDVNVSNHDLMNGVYMITFAANVPGVYEIHVALSNQHVTGSPLNIVVQGGGSTVPKVPLMMNDLGTGDTHVRHGRSAVGGTRSTGTSCVASLDKPMQALAKGCSIPSGTSKKNCELICLPETDNQGDIADVGNSFLSSLLNFMPEPQQLSQPPNCAESVTKAAPCKALAKLDSDAACLETTAPKCDKFNIKTDSSTGDAVTPASKHDTLKVKIDTGVSHQQKPAPEYDKFNIKTDSSTGRALTSASKHGSSNVKKDTGVAHQQKPAPEHNKLNIKTDSYPGHTLTPASVHDSLNVKTNTSVAHQHKPAPEHDKVNIKTHSSAGHALTPANKHDSLYIKINSSAAHPEQSAPQHGTWDIKVDSHAAAPLAPVSKHDDFNVKVNNGVAQPKTPPIKHNNVDVKRSSEKELVHSDSARLDGLKSLELASERAVLNVESASAGPSKQICKSAALPPAADGGRSADVLPRPACVVKPVGSMPSKSRSSSCTIPSVIASHTSAPADYPGSIFARVVLELDSYEKHKFSFPIGITATSEGNIIICDTGHDRVFAFNPEGRPLHEAIITGSKETFCRPSAVVAMKDGTYAVKDDVCIYVFSKHGEFIRTLGKGSLRRPYGLALHGTENLMTLSLGESVPTLRCFSASGNFERCVVYGPLARGVPAGSKCRFMDVHKGAIFVADLGLSHVYKTDTKGQPIATFGTKGKGRGQMLEPSGVSGTERMLFIGDSKNNRIQAFDSEGKFIAVVKMASGLVRPSGVYVSPADKLCVLNYLQGVAGIYNLSYLDSDS